MKNILRFVLITTTVALLAAVNTGCTKKVKKAYHESRADKFYAAGQYDSAELEYINVLRNDSVNAKAFARLGEIYFDQGRFQTAAPFLVRASSLATNDLDVREKLGQIYATAGRMQEAQAEAIFILDRNPQSEEAPQLLADSVLTEAQVAPVQARLEKLVKAGDRAAYQVALGTLAFRGNDAKTAEADFKRALTLDPKSVDALEAMGALLATHNDLKGAEADFKAAADLSPVRSTKRMLYARFKLQSGEMDAAKQLLEDVLKQAPDYIPALMGLGEIALANKQYDECHADVTKLLQRDPGNFDGMMLDSRLKFAQGDLTGTVSTLEQMVRAYPQSARVHFQLGAAYLESGDDTKATLNLNQALALDPSDADATLLLAQIQIKNQNPDPAVVALSKLVQKYPQFTRAQLLLADAYRQRGQAKDALTIYAAQEKKTPNDPQIPLLAGSALALAGDTAKAREEFERVLTLAPDNLPGLEQLVNLDVGEKNYAAAMQRIQAKLDQTPNKLALHLLVAKVQLASGDRAAAEQTLIKAESIEPQNEEPHLLLAQLYFDGKQADKAMNELQSSISRNPHNLSAMMLLATMHETAKDYKTAAAVYEKMLVENPKCSPALNNLAYLYSEYLGQLDRAYDLAQQARVLLPFDPATADTLGWICVKRGTYPTALALLRESSAKLPDQPEAQFHFGMVNYLTGNEDAARSAFLVALGGGKTFLGSDECRLCLSLLDINPQTADAAAQQKLEQRVADRSDDPVAQGRLAAIYERDGKTDKAIACYEAVLKADAKNLGAMDSLAKLYAPKDAAKAYDIAKAAYKLAPSDVDTAHIYGQLAYQNGDFKLASTMLQSAVQSQPGNATLQFDYARAAYSVGRVPDAQTALQAALAANLPAAQAGEAKRMLDLISQEYSPQPASAPQIEAILKAEPAYVPALVVQTKLKEMAGDTAAAAAACEKIIATFPDFAPAQRELAILYSKDSTKAGVAYAYAMKARTAYPDDPALAKATGIIIFQQGDFARSASILKECAANANTDAEIFYYLGADQLKLNQRVAGKANLQQAMTLKLSGPLADSAKQLLSAAK